MSRIIYARLATGSEVKAFMDSINAKNESSYKKYKSYLVRNKDKILDAYESIYQRFVEIENENNDQHKRYVKAFNSKKCACGSDVIFIESAGFWGCLNYKDTSVKHKNFIIKNDWDWDYYLKEPKKVHTSDWLRSVKEIAGLEKKINHASILSFLEKNGKEDLKMIFEGKSSWDSVNRLKNANFKAKGFESKVYSRLLEIYDAKSVFSQQPIKYQYEGMESKYCFLDFLVMDRENNKVIIVECKLSEDEKNDSQREEYIELTSFAMRSKGINMGLEFMYITPEGGVEYV